MVKVNNVTLIDRMLHQLENFIIYNGLDIGIIEFDKRYINELLEICAYCKLKSERIPAAIQLSKEEMKQLQQGNKNI